MIGKTVLARMAVMLLAAPIVSNETRALRAIAGGHSLRGDGPIGHWGRTVPWLGPPSHSRKIKNKIRARRMRGGR